MSAVDRSELSDRAPERSLVAGAARSGARDSTGQVSVRFRGGGHKQRYRAIDFKRDKDMVPARVASVEYDPNRSAHIALLNYLDGEKRYILAPQGMKAGDLVMSGEEVGAKARGGETLEVRTGNSFPLQAIPVGTLVHNVELRPGAGGQFCRSAGSGAQLVAKEGKYAHVRLPSGEVRLVLQDCYATIGQVSNLEHENISAGKAGRSRWMGWRPVVRGVAMNPIDHPLGGGEGKSSGGRHPCSPWGKLEKKTRKNKRTQKYIVKRRD